MIETFVGQSQSLLATMTVLVERFLTYNLDQPPPLSVTFTTRIIAFLVGIPIKSINHFLPLLLVGGVDPTDKGTQELKNAIIAQK